MGQKFAVLDPYTLCYVSVGAVRLTQRGNSHAAVPICIIHFAFETTLHNIATCLSFRSPPQLATSYLDVPLGFLSRKLFLNQWVFVMHIRVQK